MSRCAGYILDEYLSISERVRLKDQCSFFLIVNFYSENVLQYNVQQTSTVKICLSIMHVLH